jgi:predicted PurR-regulated permease PerM
LAAAVSIGGGLAAIAAMLVLAALSLFDNGQGIGSAITTAGDEINNAAGGQLGSLTDTLRPASLTLVQTIVSVGESLAAIGIVVLLSALLAFYFLRDGGRAWQRLTSRVGPGSVDDVRAAGRRAFDALSGYMIGTAAISLVGATTQWLVMVLLGLPYAGPVFVLSFFLCFIPYIGGYLTTGIAFLIAIGTHDPVTIVIMFVWTMAFNIVQGNVVAPVVYGRTVNIHPAVVLLAIPAGGAVAGIMGMFIAVPAIGVVVATWRTVLALLAGRPRALGPQLESALGPTDPPETATINPAVGIEPAST